MTLLKFELIKLETSDDDDDQSDQKDLQDLRDSDQIKDLGWYRDPQND